MKRTLFRALGLVELFSFLLFFTPSALAATVSAKWVVLADPFCGCGIAGWNYFSVEHRPKGSPGDTGWDSDPSHYGPYRAFVSDTTKDLTPSSGDGQLDKSQEVMVGSDGSQAFEYRIVGHPKIVVHANSTPADGAGEHVDERVDGQRSGTRNGRSHRGDDDNHNLDERG